MPSIPIEQPRVDPPADLIGYLNRQAVAINIALMDVQYFEPLTILPLRVRVGEVYYFANAIPATAIIAEGLWIYKSAGWVQIA
jgi:hypothetical protein